MKYLKKKNRKKKKKKRKIYNNVANRNERRWLEMMGRRC